MKHIEITEAEAQNRFNRGENVYIVPCYISGYFGSPLKLNKNMYDELIGKFDDIVDNYIKANCYIIVEEKLKFYRAEKEHITEAREKVKFCKLEVEGALKAQKYWENEAQSCLGKLWQQG